MNGLPPLKQPPFDADGLSWVAVSLGEGPQKHSIQPGAFTDRGWLTADFYNPNSVLLQIKLQFLPAEENRAGEIIFGLYPKVRARLRIPGTALAMNSWLLPREGALLKPMCGGDLVRAEEVAVLQLSLLAGPESNAGWWQTPWTITTRAPEKLIQAESEHIHLIDPLGQAATQDWPNKTGSESEMIHHLRSEQGVDTAFPLDWTRWGGSSTIRFEATGFFHTHHDGHRWWLVDPDGGAFWSTGICCVTPLVEAALSGLDHLLAWKPDESSHWVDAWRWRLEGENPGAAINFLAANFIRAFGPECWREKWRHLAAQFLRKRRFNTIGNWSDWELGRIAGLPYTRPLQSIESLPIPKIFRDFPDVFHPDFPVACDEWAKQLEITKDDPAFLGYFICNEPTWAVAKQTPAAGMLASTNQAYSRHEFGSWLKQRHGRTSLSLAWNHAESTEERLLNGSWMTLPQNETFQADVEAFSAVMVARLFDTLSAACRAVDPNHLNLGARFAHVPPDWMMPSLGSFDVFSFNSYSKKPRPAGAEIAAQLNRPVLIGEWHFGATDTGMPAAGLETVRTQYDRGLAYRHYLESHAERPWCVGVHWFTLYDQSAIGRFDGESYNCGFLDVCHREQPEIADAAQASHEIVYDIAAGVRPITDLPAPEYLRRLSL